MRVFHFNKIRMLLTVKKYKFQYNDRLKITIFHVLKSLLFLYFTDITTLIYIYIIFGLVERQE